MLKRVRPEYLHLLKYLGLTPFGFLTGINVTDPVKGVLISHYADLIRRVGDLDMVVHKPCVCLSLMRPITTPH